MPRNIVVLLSNPEGRSIIKKACEDNNINYSVFEELIQAEVEQTGRKRRAGLWYEFDDILDRVQGEE